ncbi:MAG TPA: UDP-N-acetylmuramoyl-tripeptide--D-alanyl-D-alanine ligase [Gemmatimonadales bacterium]|nr:UDP-N-acetylmuramoyl-tripeptide--D-alanyl-D-alanine ligase [Gemmatimonadales bacterium]
MNRWTDASVRLALGLPAGDGKEGAVFTSVCTDTRAIKAGALFVALKGERFDAHEFLPAAQSAGATGAVVRTGTPKVAGLVLYEVPDTLEALGRLARTRRREITGPVIGITGSNGKTSTKEMVSAVLRTKYQTWATRANDNNLVGVPLTILAAPDDTEALVIEAGASLLGEIPRLRAIIEPSAAIITNVGASHLEGFGSIAGVMREKLALVEDAPLAIVGTEPSDLAAQARSHARRVVTAGSEGAEVRPDRVTVGADGRPTFTIDGQTIGLPLIGRHQAGNAMFAWTLVRELGLDRTASARALEELVLPGGRGDLIQSGELTVLNDCYNANPTSFRAAIATAKSMRVGRRLVFVAGTMRELGEESARLHAEIGALLLELEPELLAAVGDFVPVLAPHAARLGDRLLLASDPLELAPLLAARLTGNELVVLKASRGVALERILPALTGTTAPQH